MGILNRFQNNGKTTNILAKSLEFQSRASRRRQAGRLLQAAAEGVLAHGMGYSAQTRTTSRRGVGAGAAGAGHGSIRAGRSGGLHLRHVLVGERAAGAGISPRALLAAELVRGATGRARRARVRAIGALSPRLLICARIPQGARLTCNSHTVPRRPSIVEGRTVQCGCPRVILDR